MLCLVKPTYLEGMQTLTVRLNQGLENLTQNPNNLNEFSIAKRIVELILQVSIKRRCTY